MSYDFRFISIIQLKRYLMSLRRKCLALTFNITKYNKSALSIAISRKIFFGHLKIKISTISNMHPATKETCINLVRFKSRFRPRVKWNVK